MLVCAFHTSSAENFIIDLKPPKDEEILNQFENDFEFLAENLSILNKRLVLLNPQPGKRKAKKKKSAQSVGSVHDDEP